MTRRCSLDDGHALVVECTAEHDQRAASLLQALLARHAAGPPLGPGSIVDVGWAPLRIEAQAGLDGDAPWQVCEPDYDAEPMIWRPGLDSTLAILDSQAATTRLLDVTPARTRCDEWLLVAPGALQAPAVYLERSVAAAPGDSGWYAGIDAPGAEADRRAAERLRAGRLVALRPQWLGVLALPVGYMTFFDADRLQTIVDADDRQVYPALDGGDG